ncbi:MAG: hypothetical protein CL886_08945 [Dehalococcoidia bacterium]|nr:hypothetical protein [Dehalococcoidia bacterium]
MTVFDVTLPPSERVSCIECEDCHIEIARLRWKDYDYGSVDGFMAMNDLELSIQDNHSRVCSAC